jgi:hypothetical protein
MISDHGQCLSRKCRLVLHHMIQIFIMSPGKHDIIHPTARCINPIFRAVYLMFMVWISLECFRVNYFLRESTANRKCIANYIPLPLCAVEEEQLPKIVDETSQLHPTWLTVSTDGLSGLEEMFDLR